MDAELARDRVRQRIETSPARDITNGLWKNGVYLRD